MSAWNLSYIGPKNEISLLHNGSFVARFKYANPKRSAKDFAKFLVANFTPEEYFAVYNTKKVPPLLILANKGYVSYNARKTGAFAKVFAVTR